MNRIDLKKQFVNRDSLFAGWTSLGHPQVTEMLLRSGVDWLGVDIEHSTISQEQSQRIIAACHANKVFCLPRVASHNLEAIKRLLDSGADGVIVPTVETVEQVEKIIEWTKYPPIGKRGFGVARAQGYGHDFEKYITEWNKSSVLVIQIETIYAVEHIEELIVFEEVDGIMVGPYDLSGSLGVPGQINHDLVNKAIERVIESCKKFGKSCGVHEVDPTVESVQASFNAGSSFVVLSSDVFALWKWGEKMKNLISVSR
jgi:2-keto-3-deoxy-L-rhamnonate aldolase RhmA